MPGVKLARAILVFKVFIKIKLLQLLNDRLNAKDFFNSFSSCFSKSFSCRRVVCKF